MKNPENIPSCIFDWINELPFEKLSPAQKTEVLKYMDETTYSDIHQASIEVAPLKNIKPAKGKTNKKQLLMERYDAHHRQKLVPLWSRPVALWKAAAVIVFLLGSFYVYTAARSEKPVDYVAQVDTVYVTKEIPAEPLKIYDTVYVTKRDKNSRTTQVRTAPVHQQGNLTNNAGMSFSGPDNTGIMPVDALQNTPNLPKRNSMKDDTLLRKFSFVTM